MEEIFKQLPLHDRLVCKRVRKHWYRILMERSTFSADRNIHLNLQGDKLCLIKSDQCPMSVFMNAKYPYDAVTFIWGIRYENSNDLLEFGRHLGKSIKQVNFINFVTYDDPQICSIFHAMSLIEKFTFKYLRIKHAFLVFDFFQCQRPNFHHLPKVLKVTGIVSESDYDVLMRFNSTNTQIKIEHLRVETQVNLELVLPVLHSFQIQLLDFYFTKITLKNLVKLFDVKTISCQRMRLVNDNERLYSFLEPFLKKHLNIKKVNLVCCCLPPPVSFSQITELELVLMEPLSSLKPLQFLENLKSLEITHQTKNCGFGHDSIILNNLETFNCTSCVNCQKCCEALATSFVNLKEFYGNIELPEETKLIQMMLNNWKYLKIMKIKCQVFYLQGQEFDSQRKYLSELEIQASKIKFTADEIGQLCTAFNNLKTFSMQAKLNQEKPSLEEIIRSVVPLLGNLKLLDIGCREHNCSCNIHSIAESEVKRILKYLEDHRYPVKVKSNLRLIRF